MIQAQQMQEQQQESTETAEDFEQEEFEQQPDDDTNYDVDDDLWGQLDDGQRQLVKSILPNGNLNQHKNNPMMLDAINMLTKDNESK